MATDLQQRVWEALKMIPRGRVTTYGDIARYLGTSAVRAVGSAVGKTPEAPMGPCHRVVLGDGRIGQYSGSEGVEMKIALLEEEGVTVSGGRIVDFSARRWDYPLQSVTSPLGS